MTPATGDVQSSLAAARLLRCSRRTADRSSVTVHTLNPLQDPRWPALVERHPRATVFHTTAWVQALHHTYGYEPTVFTTSLPGAALTNGVLLCRVRSWLTGRRMVSVPFADHCDPLVDDPRDRGSLLAAFRAATEDDCRYVELRTLTSGLWGDAGSEAGGSYMFHELDLRPPLDELYARLHRSTIQRKIHRAEREGVSSEEGRSESLLAHFYRLMILTRRRHGVPPQPYRWFAALLASLGDRVTIRVAFRGGRPIASILSLAHGNTIVYKYGCSDATMHHLGGMPLLFWKLIEDAKARGATTLDLGRSDTDNAGLIVFKDRLGACSRRLTYVRVTARPRRQTARLPRSRVPGWILAHLPDRLFVAAGRWLYPHMG